MTAVILRTFAPLPTSDFLPGEGSASPGISGCRMSGWYRVGDCPQESGSTPVHRRMLMQKERAFALHCNSLHTLVMRKHLTIAIVIVVLIIAALVFSGREIAARKVVPEGGSSSSSSPGYHLVTIVEMGITFELPDGWEAGVTNDPAQVREFAESTSDRKLMVTAVHTPGKDFTAALAEADAQTATGYEGEPSIKVTKEDPLATSVMPGVIRHRELVAAGMRDLAAVFELQERFFTVALRHDEGSDPTPEDEQLLKAIIMSVKPIQ